MSGKAICGEGDFHIAYLIDPTKPVQRDTALRLNA